MGVPHTQQVLVQRLKSRLNVESILSDRLGKQRGIIGEPFPLSGFTLWFQ